MLIFKVMVCFLAVFTSEDYVGGLPTSQDSPDNYHHAGQSVRSASNQGVTNEPGIRPTVLLDYAEQLDGGKVHHKVNPDIKMMINPLKISSAETTGGKFSVESAPSILFPREKVDVEKEEEGADQMLKFRPDAEHENENVRRDVLRKGSSSTDQFVDKSKSRNDDATSTSTSTSSLELPTSSSLGTKEKQRFSSVYTKVDLDEKVNKKKQEFKNDLSAYLTDVLDTVVSEKSSQDVRTSVEKSKNDDMKSSVRNIHTQSLSKKLTNESATGNLLSEKTNVLVLEEESLRLSPAVEYRQRKSVGDIDTWHQQSTNMRPTRTQHLVQNKRSTGEGTLKGLSTYGGRKPTVKNSQAIGGVPRGSNRRHFTTDGSSSLRQNRLQFAGVSPVQINAAMAYSNRQQPGGGQGLNVDLSRALYQFGPANLHALRGVFDKVPPSTENFKPIAPKQVAYVPPRIVYETKIIPTPFMPFRTEQKTVEALSALLGQNPTQQLQGFNLILRKDRPEETKGESTPDVASPLPEISRQGIHDGVALGQAFVTPIPSIDINSGLVDNSFRFSHDNRDPNEEIEAAIEGPFNHKIPQYHNVIQENIHPQENPFKTIPIVEEPEESQRGQALVEKEINPVWEEGEIPEKTRDQNEEGRYSQDNEEDRNHGDAYAAKYSFGYHVKDYDSGNNFGHQETRDGVITKGRYHVLLPDGRLQNVKYHVDEGGYHAKVSYQLNPSV